MQLSVRSDLRASRAGAACSGRLASMTATLTGPVNTGKVVDRRTLRLNSLDDLRAEIDRIAASERAGALKRSGNWTAGQTFGHLATWMNFAWSPCPIKAPWFVRLIVGRRKDKYLNKAMPAGVRIPRVPGGTVGTEPRKLDEALADLKTAIHRLEREAPTCPSPVFGLLTREEAIKLNLRHAELHLSYLHP